MEEEGEVVEGRKRTWKRIVRWKKSEGSVKKEEMT